MKPEILNSTSLRAARGRSVEVRVGEEVVFINPQTIPAGEKRRDYTIIKDATERHLGSGPYTIAEITQTPPERAILTLRGRNDNTTTVSARYLTS